MGPPTRASTSGRPSVCPSGRSFDAGGVSRLLTSGFALRSSPKAIGAPGPPSRRGARQGAQESNLQEARVGPHPHARVYKRATLGLSSGRSFDMLPERVSELARGVRAPRERVRGARRDESPRLRHWRARQESNLQEARVGPHPHARVYKRATLGLSLGSQLRRSVRAERARERRGALGSPRVSV